MSLIFKKNIYRLLNMVKYIFLAIFLAVFAFVVSTLLDRNIADNVTKEKILKLELGMTKEQVLKILGEPLKRIHYSKEQIGKDSDIYLYAISKFIGEGLEVNISISNGLLEGIGLEFYDDFFYKCYEDSCPKMISPLLWKYLIPNN